MHGFLDRFEGNMAVILVEEVKEEFTVNKEMLPDGSDVNTYFEIEKKHGNYHIVQIDTTKTTQEKQTTSDLMAKLRAKKTESKFKK